MARILNLPQKLQDLGRIRAGKKAPPKSKIPMEALDEWRFTSPSQEAIKSVAGIYGGNPTPWADRPEEWEVFTEAKILRVQLPSDAIFTAYEKWGQGGCQRRCDGERCVVPVQDPEGGHLDEVDCWCEDHDLEPGIQREACTVTVRLKVVLPDVPGIGVWMLTSGSVYAAMELPAIVDLIDALRQRSGILIPCTLELQYREEKRAYEKFARKFHVPTLHVDGSVNAIQTAIQGIEARTSIVPALPRGESALPPGPSAPAVGRDLPPPRREPPRGPGRGSGSPEPEYHVSYLRNLCLEQDPPLDDSGTAPELIKRLQEAGVKL